MEIQQKMGIATFDLHVCIYFFSCGILAVEGLLALTMALHCQNILKRQHRIAMIDELKADGYSVTEIVNFLLLGTALNAKPSRMTTTDDVRSRRNNKKLLYDTSPEEYQRGKSKVFCPTTEDIERGMTLFRQVRDARKLQSN